VISPPDRPRRLVFLGTPNAAVPPLRALVEHGWPIDLVVSRPDKRRRRNHDPEPSPVKQAALDLGLPVTDDLADLQAADADLGIVVAYGRIIPTPLLERLPMINLHFSLLPRWRGAAPVERAILAGDETTGVCVMQIVPELDAGAVYARREVEVGTATASELRDRLVKGGTRLLVDRLEAGLGAPVPQEGAVSHAAKIESDDLHLDWAEPAELVERVVRLERAWTTFRDARLRVLDVARVPEADLEPGILDGPVVGTGSEALRLKRVQPAGRAAMSGRDWANGARPVAGENLGVLEDGATNG
jgi:methionyl-tRNA formyltransferase